MFKVNIKTAELPDLFIVPSQISMMKLFDSQRLKGFNSSVIRQKGESQNGCFKKTKHVKFFEKTNISYPLICTSTYVFQGVRNVRFFDVTCFVFEKHLFWDSPFCLITDEFQKNDTDLDRVQNILVGVMVLLLLTLNKFRALLTIISCVYF